MIVTVLSGALRQRERISTGDRQVEVKRCGSCRRGAHHETRRSPRRRAAGSRAALHPRVATTTSSLDPIQPDPSPSLAGAADRLPDRSASRRGAALLASTATRTDRRGARGHRAGARGALRPGREAASPRVSTQRVPHETQNDPGAEVFGAPLDPVPLRLRHPAMDSPFVAWPDPAATGDYCRPYVKQSPWPPRGEDAASTARTCSGSTATARHARDRGRGHIL